MRGRTPDEVLDIVARICGICPVAYQMSAVHAFEAGAGIVPDPAVRALRRLLYCGEWIESHALHVYLLHAPDFMGYQSAIELARDHRVLVERALALKKTGNHLVARGRRPPDPSRHGPRRRLLPDPHPRGVDRAPAGPHGVARDRRGHGPGRRRPRATRLRARAAARLAAPSDRVPDERRADRLDRRSRPRARRLGGGVRGGPGRLVERPPVAHPRRRGLPARPRRRGSPSPRTGSTRGRPRRWPGPGWPRRSGANPFRSIVARAVELVHATAEALDIIDDYRPPERPFAAWTPGPGIAAWATEAPRGLLFHRYELDEAGHVATARIVPPTSQNQAAIEADLTGFAPRVLDLPHDEATLRFEQLIRSYDPCISCATHFLDLRVERRP